jgi:hypothetical protein
MDRTWVCNGGGGAGTESLGGHGDTKEMKGRDTRRSTVFYRLLLN